MYTPLRAQSFVLVLTLLVSIGLIGVGTAATPVATIDTVAASTATTDATTTFNVSNVGASYYTLDGDPQPTLTLERGQTYTFEVDAAGHPFHITTDSTGGDFGGIYTKGVTVTGAESDRTAVETGQLTFTVPEDAPDTLYYQCGIHAGMGAKLKIVNGSDTPDYESPDGEVFFTSPANGSTVTAPVNFSMDANNFVIESTANGVRAGHGHLNILVDKSAVPPGQQIPTSEGYYHYGNGSTQAQLNLSSGHHTIILQAGDANHTAYNLTDTIEITVPNETDTSAGVSVQFESETILTSSGGSTTVDLQATNVNNGIRSYSYTATVSNTSVATITNVELVGASQGGLGVNVTITADGSKAIVSVAQGDDNNGVFSTLTLSTQTTGTTDLRITQVTLGDDDFSSYNITGTTNATVEVSKTTAPPAIVGNNQPTDPDGDGKFDDLTGDGRVNILDVGALLQNRNSPAVQNNPTKFDFTGDDRVNILDVGKLLQQVL